MARRRRAASAGAKIIRMPVRSPAPIIKVAAPRAPKRARRSRRRSHVSGGGLFHNSTLQYALGGVGYGLIAKSGILQKLPAVPVIGRTGLAAILLGYWGRHGGGDIVNKVANAAAAIAGAQFGQTGTVLGDASPDYDGYTAEGFDTMGFDTMGDDDDVYAAEGDEDDDE